MASSAAGDSGVVGARAGRKTKKGPKSKVNSLVDEVPTFIEEIIPSPDGGPPQTIKYVRILLLRMACVHSSPQDGLQCPMYPAISLTSVNSTFLRTVLLIVPHSLVHLVFLTPC